MVFYGYILPKQNQEIRHDMLLTSLSNNRTKVISNSFLNVTDAQPGQLSSAQPMNAIDAYNNMIYNNTITNRVPGGISELGLVTPGTAPSTPIRPGILRDAAVAARDDPNVRANLQNERLPNLDAFQTELRNAVVKRELSPEERQAVDKFEKKLEDKPTFETFKEAYEESTTVLADFDSDYLKVYKDSSDVLAKVLKSAMNDLGYKKINIYNNVNKGNTTKSHITFKEDKDKTLQALYSKGRGTHAMSLRQLYSTLQQAAKNNDGIIAGEGLVRSKYYTTNAANFGNLYLNHNSLKRGNLSISQPYSKTYVLTKKNITPLLRKMVFDIANTLEFDSADYHNLEKDEKIIIEKIIRAQKNMKDVNIVKLLDDDDRKIKKRLEILVGEVNAGNHSTMIRKEMKELLKKLYDNRAISLSKYTSSVKSLKSLD